VASAAELPAEFRNRISGSEDLISEGLISVEVTTTPVKIALTGHRCGAEKTVDHVKFKELSDRQLVAQSRPKPYDHYKYIDTKTLLNKNRSNLVHKHPVHP
jgi:hypothetical protein